MKYDPIAAAERPEPYFCTVTGHWEHWCPDCQHVVVLDDGCCSCGKVIDWDAFEAADKRLAELNADPDAALYARADHCFELLADNARANGYGVEQGA